MEGGIEGFQVSLHYYAIEIDYFWGAARLLKRLML